VDCIVQNIAYCYGMDIHKDGDARQKVMNSLEVENLKRLTRAR
jgi:hypothetical protein